MLFCSPLIRYVPLALSRSCEMKTGAGLNCKLGKPTIPNEKMSLGSSSLNASYNTSKQMSLASTWWRKIIYNEYKSSEKQPKSDMISKYYLLVILAILISFAKAWAVLSFCDDGFSSKWPNGDQCVFTIITRCPGVCGKNGHYPIISVASEKIGHQRHQSP